MWKRVSELKSNDAAFATKLGQLISDRYKRQSKQIVWLCWVMVLAVTLIFFLVIMPKGVVDSFSSFYDIFFRFDTILLFAVVLCMGFGGASKTLMDDEKALYKSWFDNEKDVMLLTILGDLDENDSTRMRLRIVSSVSLMLLTIWLWSVSMSTINEPLGLTDYMNILLYSLFVVAHMALQIIVNRNALRKDDVYIGFGLRVLGEGVYVHR